MGMQAAGSAAGAGLRRRGGPAASGEAVPDGVAQAKATGKPVAVGRRDFREKKAALREAWDRQAGAGAVGALPKTGSTPCCTPAPRAPARGCNGVHPASTSTIGSAKFGSGHGRSPHARATAGMARRGCGFGERLRSPAALHPRGTIGGASGVTGALWPRGHTPGRGRRPCYWAQGLEAFARRATCRWPLPRQHTTSGGRPGKRRHMLRAVDASGDPTCGCAEDALQAVQPSHRRRGLRRPETSGRRTPLSSAAPAAAQGPPGDGLAGGPEARGSGNRKWGARARTPRLPHVERHLGARLRRQFNIWCARRRAMPPFVYWR
jgi:hypothetical protein